LFCGGAHIFATCSNLFGVCIPFLKIYIHFLQKGIPFFIFCVRFFKIYVHFLQKGVPFFGKGAHIFVAILKVFTY
jgi:hypothetical protein